MLPGLVDVIIGRAMNTSFPGRHFAAFALASLAAGCGGRQGAGVVPAMPELRTVETAVRATVTKAGGSEAGQPGYLGVAVAAGEDGVLRVIDAAAGSPAEKAGVKAGDVMLEFDGQSLADAEDLRERVLASVPGAATTLLVERGGAEFTLPVEIGAVSRPLALAAQRAILGIQLGASPDGRGAPVTRVTKDSPAEKAGLKLKDLLLAVDEQPVNALAQLIDYLATKNPGEAVTLAIERDGKPQGIRATLMADPATEPRLPSYWKKDLYRLAVIGVEFADLKHNAKVAAKDWDEQFFSKATYADRRSATGQPVFGSLNDYYVEQSCGASRIEGKVFEWVPVEKKRAEYSPGTGSRAQDVFFTEVLTKLEARDGKTALETFDGILFIYAGGWAQGNRGGLYWPHRGTTTVATKRWPFIIVPEGGERMNNISVVAHEFGHILGLPDLYARPENPGSTGLGAWSVMSNQVSNGRPQHMDPWCKEQLGWLKPAVIDPRVPQRLVLSPVEGSPTECFKVLVRLDGSEYFLVENRKKHKFDRDLAAEGLMIWRVVKRHVALVVSHGIDGPAAPGVFLRSIPYPSASNDAFTPFTTPSSRSQLGGGWPVSITNIRRLDDGRVEFTIGVEYE